MESSRRPTHIRHARPALAGIMLVIALLMATVQYGTITADQGSPSTPANPLASLIVPENQTPHVRVTWDEPPGEAASSYTITRNDGTSAAVNAPVTQHRDTTVRPGQSYSYRVTARNAGGASPASAAAAVTVPPAPSAPGRIQASAAAPSPADEAVSVTLAWTGASIPEAGECETAHPILGYAVERLQGDDVQPVGTLGADARSFTDDMAAFNTDYTYRVTARNAVGSGPPILVQVTTPLRPVTPPTGLTAAINDPFDGAVTLSWTGPAAGPETTGYQLIRTQGENTETLAENQQETSFRDETASVGIPYSYTVRAVSAGSVSPESGPVSIEIPAPVTGLTATPAEGSVQLAWSEPSGTPAGYRVQRRTGDGEWETLGDSDSTGYADPAPIADTPHTYRVQHRNVHGGSAWAESREITIISLPGRPEGLAATADGNDNLLSWQAPDSVFLDGYRVQHHTGEGQWAMLDGELPSSLTAYRHTAAQADVTHHYQVQAHNRAGSGPWSLTAATARITPPLAPGGVTAALEEDDIILTWTRPGSVHVSGYTVRHRAGGADYTESERLPESQTSYRVSGVTGDVAYQLAVKAHNDGGESPWSDDAEITRLLPPGAPTGVTAAAGDVNIVVSWTTPETGTVHGYHVGYGDTASDQWTTVDADASDTSFTHTGSVEGTTYRYRVRAHNAAGNSPWSSTETAMRILTPGVPTNVAAQVSGSTILITWTASAPGIVTGYEVQFGIVGSETTETQGLGSGETAFVHTSPRGDTAYQYRVRSVNAAGNSDWSEAVQAMWVVPPLTPTGVTVEIIGDDLLVSWTAPTGGIIDRYEVEKRQLDREEWTRNVVQPESTSHTHAGPTPGATYQYRVRTVNQGGASEWTTPVNGVWFQGAAPPKRIFVQTLGQWLYVSWTESVTPGVTAHEMRYRVDGGEWTQATMTKRYHLVDWSTGDTLHEYSMRALIDDQPGDWSPIKRVTIALPAAVPNVTANRESANGVRLHWETPSSGAPAFFRIQTRQDGGDYYSIGSAGAYASTYLATYQLHETTMDYRVLAANHVSLTGPEGPDSSVSVSIPAAPNRFDELPSGLKITMTDRETVKLTWEAPAERANRVYSYRIYRKQVSDSRAIGQSYRDHVLVPFTGNTNTVYIDRTARTGVAYEYALAAQRSRQDQPTGALSAEMAYAKPW